MIVLQPGFLKYHQDKTTAKDGPRVGASPAGRVKKSIVHAPTNPKALYAMPVVAVIGAIVSIGAGITAAAAATTVVGAIVAGAMIVGGALTIVGVVTGNEKLMKVGSILSLAGGAASAFGIGAEAASSMSGLSSAGAGTIEAAEAGLTAAEATQAGMAGGGFNVAATGTAGTGLDAANAAGGSTSSGILDAVESQAVDDLAADAVRSGSGVSGATPAVDPLGNKSAFDGSLANDASAFAAKGPQALPGEEGGGILDWVNKNKEVAKLGVDTLGGIAKAVPTDASRAQTDAMRANAEQSRASAGLTTEQAYAAYRRQQSGSGKRAVTFDAWKTGRGG